MQIGVIFSLVSVLPDKARMAATEPHNQAMTNPIAASKVTISFASTGFRRYNAASI